MIEIKITKVLDLLNEGKSRQEIADYFGISLFECKKLFLHPKLKGKKAKKQLPFNIIDDTEITEDNKQNNEKLKIW